MINIGLFCCLFLSPTLRMRSRCCYLVSCFILSSFLFVGSDACWGTTAPNYGDMSRDYDLPVGSDLVLNCTLKKLNFADFPRPVNSSDLVIEKEKHGFPKYTRVINDRSIQLKIPNATMNDTGVYICKILLNKENKPVVCGSKVSVGYPPHHVTNFSCISRNFDNLNCSWNAEENDVLTKYTIVKYFYNLPDLAQNCPSSTEKPNSCEWSINTYPSYEPFRRDISFTITGTNSLGKTVDNFTIDGHAIVIPNSPEDLEALEVGNNFVTVGWKPPTMRNFAFGFPTLKYQIWISKVLYDSSDISIYDTGNSTSSFTIKKLIPYVSYNVSIRCRSSYAEKEDMWSTFASLVLRTLPDVPYKSPKVIPEAYALHMYEDSRSAELYFKAVPKLHHNGENFHYHIKYFETTVVPNASKVHSVNSSIPFVSIKHLLKNTSYSFHIFSANEKGISSDYGSISIESEDKIPPAPKDVTVISQDSGPYHLSWNPPNDKDVFNYTVFWCSSLKPWLSRCDSSIQWIEENLSETKIALNLTDSKTNFQFAVASKSMSGSSGMQWASCIVPHKGGLSKIKYVVVEQKSSTSLKVIWNLDCPAEKAVVKRYEITYCGIQENKDCNVVEVEPHAENFLLDNLHPFSNYSVKIRAINKDDKASEDSDAVFQSTLPGAPSGPPQNVQAFSNSKDSFFVSWTPPAESNGIITKYIISYNGSKLLRIVEPAQNESQNEYSLTVYGLKPYTKYAVQIQACVNNDCSVKSVPVSVQTDVDAPGYMEPPRIEEVNSTHFKVSWTVPVLPNGPIDFYVIKWHKESQNATSDADNILEVAGANSIILDVKCPSLRDEAIKYLFYVRAVNKKNGTNLLGPFSESTQVRACPVPEGLGMFIGTIVGATFGAALFLVIIYRFALWMKLKIHQVKSITIRLPEGLEGPETNPLNNYECFKNGLNENLQSNNSERLSYIVDENKNRHGSGSSQFSNSSAEELIFKNGKCTKFGRKPSGDSSGCSSMSSNATPRLHLSSDSGTESDFAIPPSPDSAITEPSLHNSYKMPLPILMEVHDQPSLEKNSLNQAPEMQNYKYQTSDDIILKVDPPYSKFGYAGNPTSSVPWRVNPLAFYSCNLANSEPSVFDAQKPDKSEEVMTPYSKVGLAKSSGDIGMSAVKQMGYSKFGLPSSYKRFSVPPSNLNPIAMIMLENPDQKEWPNIKKVLDDNYAKPKVCNNTNAPISSSNLVEDCGYIKIGINVCPEKSSHGYVPFSDLRSQMDHCHATMSVNPADQMKNVYGASLTDKDQGEFPDDTEWPTYHNCEGDVEIPNVGTSEILFDMPFSENSVGCTPLQEEIFISGNHDFKLPDCQNSNESLPNDSDVKYNSDSSTLSFSEVSFESNPLLQNHVNSSPNDSKISLLNGISTVQESHPCQVSNKTASYSIPDEVIVTPSTLRNNYVPFNSLSDSVSDRTLKSLPNVPELNLQKTIFPNGVCTEIDNYITPTPREDLRLLRDNSHPKTISVVSNAHRDSLNNIQNENGYANLSLKYILKPLPKMESEICEV